MSQWFTDSFRTEFDKQSELLGRFNLALFGKTGVGKSTLVNAIFGEPVAATGIGQPVTQAPTSTSTSAGNWASWTPRVWRSARTTSS